MALAATTIHEVQTGGDDTNNGGMFDPGQTAGMLTDGAATLANTASPVFTSASYSFTASDVGAYVYQAAGTNALVGWFPIVSVAAGAATLGAAINGAVLLSTQIAAVGAPLVLNTVAGCATVASPTGITWTIDYSQQAANRVTYTDLASAGAGLTASSAAKPLGKQMVGNGFVITGGTNFTAGRYVLASVNASFVGTFVGAANMTTGVGASGTGAMGGAFASLGKVGAHIVASNRVFIKTGTYTQTSASNNVAGGQLSLAVSSIWIEGYDTVRNDLKSLTATGTRPTIAANGSIVTFTQFAGAGAGAVVWNLILDGNSRTSSRGFAPNNTLIINCLLKNFTNSAVATSGGNLAYMVRCEITGCSTTTAVVIANSGMLYGCTIHGNTVTGFSASFGNVALYECIAYANSGATSDGFSFDGVCYAFNCNSYGNGRDGFRVNTSPCSLPNCIAEGNGGVGFNVTSSAISGFLMKVAAYNNAGGDFVFSSSSIRLGFVTQITGSGTFFTNAAGGDFSLNNNAGAGALLRAQGYPGTMPGGLSVGYQDVGALQHLDAGGGGVMFSPGLTGGLQ